MANNPYFIDYPSAGNCIAGSVQQNLQVTSTPLTKISAANIAEVIRLVVKEVLAESKINGNILVDGEELKIYSLPPATDTQLGGVLLGEGLVTSDDGSLSLESKIKLVSSESLPETGEEDTVYINKDTGAVLVFNDGSYITNGISENIILSGGKA